MNDEESKQISLDFDKLEISPNPSKQKKKKRTTILVSKTKNKLFFYVNLTKKSFKSSEEVELNGIGEAISTVVTISEILKKSGASFEKSIMSSSVHSRKVHNGMEIPIAKLTIVLRRTEV